MIDYRLLTFMDLHETMNYTKTAKNLHITQPAVTQHIQYSERKYHVQLFRYEKKRLACTKEGEYLYRHALSLVSGADKLIRELSHICDECETLRIGATMSIGETILPQFLLALYCQKENLDVELSIGNTEKLIKEVREGSLDFAWIEDRFDKEEFHSHLLKREAMILIMPDAHPLLSRKTLRMEDLLGERLFILEQDGAAVFEQALTQCNLSLQSFAACTQIPQLSMIKRLVEGGGGIAFLYESAVREELAMHKLATHKVMGFKPIRDFHMIAQKHSIYLRQYDAYFKFFKQSLK